MAPSPHPTRALPDGPLLFDAVLFDLDGTLVATDRFWLPAARAGAHRAFAELGLDRAMPSAREWMSLCGYPLDDGFRRLFPDLASDLIARVQSACVEEEQRLLEAGGATLLPGAADALEALCRHGARVGLASNCSGGYLRHMLVELGLEGWIAEARCLDSAGVGDKSDMVLDLLQTFGTRSAVMVGDRPGDRDAAWANGIPHVHFASGTVGFDEDVAADATIEALAELEGVLLGRTAWVRGALERIDAWPDGRAAGRVRSIGVTGSVAAGKGLFARDAARLLEAHGTAARVASLERWRTKPPVVDGDPLDAFDLAAVRAELLEPHARGDDVALAAGAGGAALDVPGDALLVLEGAFLLDPRLRAPLDRVVSLELDEQTSLRRLAAREGREGGPRALAEARRALPGALAFARRYDPRRADLVLPAGNPLGQSG